MLKGESFLFYIALCTGQYHDMKKPEVDTRYYLFKGLQGLF